MPALTWEPDAAHVRLARWQVRVLERWADEDDDAEESARA
uniref:Uncharacterized protein n=1 Tax=Mycobacterium phage JustASigh TaxID=3158894 RepID=A0AAU8GMR2_9CAUD